MASISWLTKSRFLAGVQCHKRLWQQCHAPLERSEEPAPQITVGIEVGLLAHRLFPGGVSAYRDGLTSSEAIAITEALLRDETAPAIFEATLVAGRLLARMDILERLPAGAWAICEVKSSTAVKSSHIDDAAFQLQVARQAGLNIERVEIVHVNNEYVLGNDGLDVARYFHRTDITAEALDRLGEIDRDISSLLAMVDEPLAPAIEPWSQASRSLHVRVLGAMH